MVKGPQGIISDQLKQGWSDMALIFVVKEGPRLGDQFRPHGGLSIGRSRGEITLRDPKVSNPHAKIIEGEDGLLYMVDEGSSNGLWLDDRKTEKIQLRPGISILLGNTLIEVVEEAELDLPQEQRETWRGKLWTQLRSDALLMPKPTQAQAFPSPLRLEFIEGPCLGTAWTLGYGPRLIGRHSPDLFLPDESLPAICVEIRPTANGPVLIAKETGFVLLNEREVSSEKINNGDVIRIGRHAIRVTM